jgi:hypothetical protein
MLERISFDVRFMDFISGYKGGKKMRKTKYSGMTIDILISEILADQCVDPTDEIRKAMEEAFREGWHRGEDYQISITRP